MGRRLKILVGTTASSEEALPPFYLAKQYPEKDYQEWMDAYWAKDVQELFRVERRASFFRFFELLVQQSGGIFQANSLAGPVGASRPTLSNYLQILSETYVFFVLKTVLQVQDQGNHLGAESLLFRYRVRSLSERLVGDPGRRPRPVMGAYRAQPALRSWMERSIEILER